MGIEIKPVLDSDPASVLLLPPCIDLDRYVLHHVLEAPAEFSVRLSPTMRFADCHAVLVKLSLEGCVLESSFGESNFNAAFLANQVARKNAIPMWRVSFGNHHGYGRNFEEALCKLAICRRFDIRRPH